MSETKKYSMFPSGLVVATAKDGSVIKANVEEVAQHLAAYLPAEYEGEKLAEVMYDPDSGYVYGRYATKKVKKRIFAQQSANPNKTEPVDGSQKVKDTKVPRNPSKAKPETANVTKDRPDVGSPTEVRTKDYQRGKGGEDLHSDAVPRSTGNSGLEGSKGTTFEKEEGDSATSGKPDTYVQKFTPSEKPAAAGTEANHAAGTEVQFRSAAEIYQNLNLVKTAEGETSIEDRAATPAEKTEEQNTKKKMPWEDPKDDASVTAATKTDNGVELETKLSEAKQANKEQEALINRMKIREARTAEAIKYALSLLKINPQKYADADVFSEFVKATAGKMSVEAIKTATEEVATIHKAAGEMKVKTAQNATQELTTAIVIPAQEGYGKEDTGEKLKNIFMDSAKLSGGITLREAIEADAQK